MSGAINTSSFHSDLLPGLVKKWFGVVPKDYEQLYSKMMDVETSNQAYEIHGSIVGLGSLVEKPEGSAVAMSSAQESYKPRYEFTTYGLGFAITQEAMEDGNAFKNAKRYTEMLARNARIAQEVTGASIINFAGTSGKTMLGGDGEVLASASHPTRSGVQSNILASGADLSEAAIEAIRVQVRNAKDNRGFKLNLQIKNLIINPAQEALAHRILKSSVQVDSLNNANFLKDTAVVKGIVVNPYLTSTTQWQVTTTQPDGVKFIMRKAPTMDTDNEFMTKNGVYSVVGRWTAGWDDYRGIYVSL